MAQLRDILLGISQIEWTETLLKWVSDNSKTIEIKKKEFFYQPGQPIERLGYILGGLLCSYFVDRKGAEHVKAFRKSGEFILPYGEMLQSIPSITWIRAEEDTTLIELTLPKRINPEDRLAFHQFRQLIAEQFYLWKERREMTLLTQTAEERFETFKKDYPGLHLRLNQYTIAAYLGITPVSLSRLIKKKVTRKS